MKTPEERGYPYMQTTCHLCDAEMSMGACRTCTPEHDGESGCPAVEDTSLTCANGWIFDKGECSLSDDETTVWCIACAAREDEAEDRRRRENFWLD